MKPRMEKLVVKAKRKCYSFMIMYNICCCSRPKWRFEPGSELDKRNWTHAITSLSSLCTDTGPNEKCESKHMKNYLKCHLFTSEKIPPFLSPSSVISCNFKSISCLTMDCFEHAVFFSFFCLITDLLHLLILVTADTNEIFLEV